MLILTENHTIVDPTDLPVDGINCTQDVCVGPTPSNPPVDCGPDTVLGARRTSFGSAPAHDEAAVAQAMIEKEPITVVLSQKGWIRAMRGHLADTDSLAFKEGDALHTAFHAETTDKVLIFTTGGKFYTLEAARLPGGRGHGEPLRVSIDMENDVDVIAAFRHDPTVKRLLVSTLGNGFIVRSPGGDT